MELCKETMQKSYRNISFREEERAERDFQYYSELLASDLEALGENKGNYREKFIDKVMAIYHRQSNCVSAMIVGPARFPTRRAQKAWDSRDKAENEFIHWRAKYFKAVNRVKTLSPEAEIEEAMAQIERLENKKEMLIELRELFKSGTPEQQSELFYEIYPNADTFTIGYILGQKQVPSYMTTSLTTKIRERKKKIEVMKSRIERKENFEPIIFNGGKIFIENDRVIISHDEKPSREIIDAIKRKGFRWSPKCKNWCRKHTENALYETKLLLNQTLGGAK
jgi:hypothetical protein